MEKKSWSIMTDGDVSDCATSMDYRIVVDGCGCGCEGRFMGKEGSRLLLRNTFMPRNFV